MPHPGQGAEVPAAADGERLDRYVALLTGSSRSAVARAIRSGEVLLDGEPVTKGSTRLAAGDLLEVRFEPRPDVEVPRPQEGVELVVVHEDDQLAVIDKPAGLVVHPAPGHPDNTLYNGLLARYPGIARVGDPTRPGIVHRLDRMTSGLLVVALTPSAHESLVSQLAHHGVERVYSAMVAGHLAAPHGVVDAPIGRSRRNPLRMTVAAGAKQARTHFEVVEEFGEPECTLLRCRLETGRTHQIRVHMRSIGHPVMGDELYGTVRPGVSPPRMFLHAEALGFLHPESGEPVRFTSALPADLAGWLDSMRGARPAG